MTVDDLVCSFCGEVDLRCSGASGGGSDHDAIVCLSCGARHDVIAGAPYPGGFGSDDFVDVVGLVVRQSDVLPVSTIRTANGLFGQAIATRHVDFASTDEIPGFDREMLAANFSTFRHFNALLGGASLKGAAVLALASGIGLDAVGLIDAGADMTILEPSPVSLAARRRTDPDVRCVGGLPHRIPFDDETFDLVCYNGEAGAPSAAALQDIVRVLKVGGRLFLSGIAFDAPAPDGERRPGLATFAMFHDAVQCIPAASIAALITRTAAHDRLAGASALGEDLVDSWIPAWGENFDVLRTVASFSSFVVLRTSGDPPVFRTVPQLSIRPGMVASWCGDKATGLDRLIAFAPESLTLLEPRCWLTVPSRGAGETVLARWIEAVDGSSPPLPLAIACEGIERLDLTVDGRLEGQVLLDSDGRGDVVLAPRGSEGRVLVELRLPQAVAAGAPSPTVEILQTAPARR